MVGAMGKYRRLLKASLVVNSIGFILFAAGILEQGLWFEGKDTGVYGMLGHIVVEGFVIWKHVIALGAIKQMQWEVIADGGSKQKP